MSYEEIERAKARDRLRYIVDAVKGYPRVSDPILVDTDLLELLKIASFAECDLQLDFSRRGSIEHNSIQWAGIDN